MNILGSFRCMALLLLSISYISADDLTTKDGKKYANYSIDRPTPYGLQVSHDHGIVIVPFAKLPDDLRQKYKEAESRAPEEIKKIEAQKAEDSKRQKKLCYLAENEDRIVLMILNRLPNGWYHGSINTGFYAHETDDLEKLIAVLNSRQLRSYRRFLAENNTPQKGSTTRDEEVSFCKNILKNGSKNNRQIIVRDIPQLYTQSEQIIVTAWPIGTYKYDGQIFPLYSANKAKTMEYLNSNSPVSQ